MQLFPVDDRKRIYQVTDVVDQHIIDWVNQVDWLNIKTDTFVGPNGELFPRATLDKNDPNVVKLRNILFTKIDDINNILGTTYKLTGISFWIDSPGFNMAVHTDEGVENIGATATMQLYLHAPDESYGTEFFKYDSTKLSAPIKNQETIFKFKSIPNTGYMMLNHLNEDGSKPMIWHGMLNKVPQGSYRLSAYWYFN